MKDWVKLQRDLYFDIRNEVDLLVQKKSKSFRQYEREFVQDLSDLKASTAKDLIQSINQADTVFFGDFHTLRQSQRLLLRLLRDRKIKKPKILALEVLNSVHEKLLNHWQQRPTAAVEHKLKSALELEKKFGASFETFAEIFKECRKNKIVIKGLFHSSTSISERDRRAIHKIKSFKERTWVLFGEYHCARSHLPTELQNSDRQKKIAVVQQNDDRASLKFIAEMGGEKTLILKSNSKSTIPLFCILHTPLWVKWQSYLDRYLLTTDLSAEADSQLNLREQIIWSLQTLMQFLNDSRYQFRKSESDLLDLEVFGPDDPQFGRSLSKLNAAEKRSVLHQLRSSNTAVLPSRRRIYLTEQTVNSCSQAAGLYLFQLEANIDFKKQEFFTSVFVEALAFFMSKLLNHSRQAMHWKDLELLAARKNSRQKESRAILFCKNFSRHGLNESWRKNLRPFQSHATVALGRILGDSVFEAFLSGEFSRSRLIRLVTSPIKNEAHAFERVVELQSIARDFDPKKSRIW